MLVNIGTKFFEDDHRYFLGCDKPSVIDYVYFHELHSAMYLSGQGTSSEFLPNDPSKQEPGINRVVQWYNDVSNEDQCIAQAHKF